MRGSASAFFGDEDRLAVLGDPARDALAARHRDAADARRVLLGGGAQHEPRRRRSTMKT